MREVDLCFKVTGHAFIVGEFAAIVFGDGTNPILVWGEAMRNGVVVRLSRLTADPPGNGIPGLALDQSGSPVHHDGLADHGVAFPVTARHLASTMAGSSLIETRREMSPRRS